MFGWLSKGGEGDEPLSQIIGDQNQKGGGRKAGVEAVKGQERIGEYKEDGPESSQGGGNIF